MWHLVARNGSPRLVELVVLQLRAFGADPDLAGVDGLAVSRGRARRVRAKGGVEAGDGLGSDLRALGEGDEERNGVAAVGEAAGAGAARHAGGGEGGPGSHGDEVEAGVVVLPAHVGGGAKEDLGDGRLHDRGGLGEEVVVADGRGTAWRVVGGGGRPLGRLVDFGDRREAQRGGGAAAGASGGGSGRGERGGGASLCGAGVAELPRRERSGRHRRADGGVEGRGGAARTARRGRGGVERRECYRRGSGRG